MAATDASLGQVYDPLGTHLQDPYPLYELARRDEPVFWSPRLGAWVVTRWEDVHRILRDPARFSSGNAIREVVPTSARALEELEQGYPQVQVAINSDGAEHQARRAPLLKAFGTETAAALEPAIREHAEELVDALGGARQAELRSAFTDPLPLDIILRVFGIDPKDAPQVRGGARAMAVLFISPLPEDAQVEEARKLVAFQHLAARYVHERAAAPGPDFISTLIATAAPDGGPLSFEQEADVVGNVNELLFAGHFTTMSVLANGLRALLTHRDQWELLCARPELIPGAVEELLRYDPSITALFRVVTEDVTVAGQELPAGAELVLVFSSANRDDRLVEDPARLDVTRPPSRHLTFGMGPHFCAGAPLARKELQVALETLTRRLPGLRLAAGEELEVETMFNVRVPRVLPVEW